MYPKENTTVHMVNILVVGGVCWMRVNGLLRNAIATSYQDSLVAMLSAVFSPTKLIKPNFLTSRSYPVAERLWARSRVKDSDTSIPTQSSPPPHSSDPAPTLCSYLRTCWVSAQNERRLRFSPRWLPQVERWRGEEVTILGEDPVAKAKPVETQTKDNSPVPSGSRHESPAGTSSGNASSSKKTAAEIRFEETQRKRRLERVAKLASKTHKDRVHEFNAKLESLSEHHDIPKAGRTRIRHGKLRAFVHIVTIIGIAD
ncbi:hypothetical protein AG1IA_06125 [Rhizoctonia solani AG-1 IA]|uniref:Uncharacterized protein n=1 Tax=Thanatephorus cucumeris (strain AG1-IA) TaxID=983506 RepID=L8WU29_THACA|nr:hypothetical protein AG1IA_06125 [Rhizoctonia solani AG-1 IA]